MTIHGAQPSASTLLVVGRAIGDARSTLAERWGDWLVARGAAGQMLAREALGRVLHIMVGTLGHTAGPLRREAREAWLTATELFGRLAEARGLAAGEVVDELQHLRELLIVELGDLIVAMPARQQMTAVLRLNRVCDLGVANAVVGYTDALVAKMFSRDGVPVPTADSLKELLAQLDALEAELARLDERSAR